MYLLLIARLVVKRYTTGTLGAYVGRWHDFVYRASLSEPHTKAVKRGYWQILSLQTQKFYKNQKSLQFRVTSIAASSLSLVFLHPTHLLIP